MDAGKMVPLPFWGVIWARAKAIPDNPGSWGRFLSSILAGFWAAAIWTPGALLQTASGTGNVVALVGVYPAALWMSGIAALPLTAYLADSVILRVVSSVAGLITWITVLMFMVLHGHILHLSAATCVVSIIACLRADALLIPMIMQRVK